MVGQPRANTQCCAPTPHRHLVGSVGQTILTTAPSAAAPPKAARPAKPRASPLAARQATLQQMRAGGGHANYWQSAEGRTAHAALPAYTPPPAKPRPPPPTTTAADLERQGSADSSAAAPPTPAAPSDGGSSPLFHTQPAGASPAPKPIKPAGPRTGYGAGPAGAAPAVGPSKPKDVYGRVREGGVPARAPTCRESVWPRSGLLVTVVSRTFFFGFLPPPP